MRVKYRLIVSAIILALLSCVGNIRNVQAANCDDVWFVFARGSGEELDGPSYTAWRDAISSSLKSSKLKYNFYELGSAEQSGYRYPAVSVGDSFSGFGRMIGALVSGGMGFQFGNSVLQGTAELRIYLRDVSMACPQTKFVLGGYSQGAQVVSADLSMIESQKIIYATTFGDPKLYFPEGKGWNPPACSGKDLSDYRAYVPDCHAYEGILGGYQPYEPEEFLGKVGAWCNKSDIMCSSGASIDDHTAYVSSGLYSSAARRIRTKLKAVYPRAFQKGQRANTQNVAFLIDTTGSMRSHLDEYKAEMLRLVKIIIDQGGSVAVAEYRDLGDGFSPQLRTNLTEDYTQVASVIDRLQADGGGDKPESTLSAALYTLNHVAWEHGATKNMIILTDAAFHRPDLDGTTLEQVRQRSLEIDPVNISILTLPNVQQHYRELASKTGGKVYDLSTLRGRAKVTQEISQSPDVVLSAEEYYGHIGEVVTFDASDSESMVEGDLKYSWDADGDGNFEIIGVGPVLQQQYDKPFSGFVQVKAEDAQGRIGTMSARLEITESKQSPPQILSATVEQTGANEYSIKYATDAERVLVALDDEPIGYKTGVEQKLVINNVTASTMVRLIPYSPTRGRGPARVVRLADASVAEVAEMDGPNGPGSTAENSNVIPLAPNTGVPR